MKITKFSRSKSQAKHLRPVKDGLSSDHNLSFSKDAKQLIDKLSDDNGSLIEQFVTILEYTEKTLRRQQQRIEQLEKLALTDELTGVFNRRGLIMSLNRELSLTTRDMSKGGVFMMFDVDKFKLTNDTYGHAAGDACLQTLTTILSDNIRRSDIVGRMSGDEFAVILTNTTEKAAKARIDDIIKATEKFEFTFGRHKIKSSASCGVIEYNSKDQVQEILDAADIKMYKVKNEG